MPVLEIQVVRQVRLESWSRLMGPCKDSVRIFKLEQVAKSTLLDLKHLMLKNGWKAENSNVNNKVLISGLRAQAPSLSDVILFTLMDVSD